MGKQIHAHFIDRPKCVRSRLHHAVAALLTIILIYPNGASAGLRTGTRFFHREGKAQIKDKEQPKLPQSVVEGKITNERGEAMPGVTVQVKGTTTGVVTNEKGQYIITVPEGRATLVISSIGYQQQEISVRGAGHVDVHMQPANTGLNQVVVVGYGTQKKVSVTGAISELPVKQIQQFATPSLSNAIGGKIAGVITRQSSGEPGYDQAQVYIRGLGTTGNAAPLVLVDGVERDMNLINPEAIESFTILKDASATAVYGVRGANGVILITTKRGKVGKPHITFRTEEAQLTAMRLPQYIDGAAYASLVNEANAHVGLPEQYTADDIQKYKDGSDPYFHPNVNWTDVILKRHTYQTMNNLSITGGTNIIRYYTNVGFLAESGIYKEDDLNRFKTNDLIKRYNFRSNIDISVSKSLSLFLGLGGIIQTGHYPGTGAPEIFQSLKIISPIEYPVTNPDGSVAGGPSYLGENPWGLVTQNGYSTQERHTLQSTFSGKWDLSELVTHGLSVNGKFAYDYYNFAGVDRRITYALKQYLGKDPNTGEDKYNVVREGQPIGYAPFNADDNRTVYIEGSVNYEHNFKEKHDVGAMLLYNQREYLNITADNSTDGLPYRSRGVAGRATYSYANRYLGEFDFGYNGSENFPPGKKFGFFPSVSAGWIVSNEKFWHVPFVSLLKLRGSYGKVGNDQIGGARFLFLTTVAKNTNTAWFGTSQQAYSGFDEGQIGNPDVTWETSTKKDMGIDLNLWKDRIQFQGDVFSEYRSGILMQRQTIPLVTGFFPWILPYANLGKVKNKGIDLSLNIKNTTPGGLYYSFTSTFTFAHNKVLANDEPPQLYAYQSAIGHPIGAPFGLKATGLFQDQKDIDQSPVQQYNSILYPGDVKYADVNGDSVVNSYDRIFLNGYPRTPEITYGFGGTLGLKGFEISVFFSGAARTSLFLNGPSIFPFQRGPGSYNILTEYYDNRWTPDHLNAKYPAATPGDNTNNFQNSSLYLRNASYLRLKNAEIAYTLPQSTLSKYKISSLRIFINGTNLMTIDKLKFMDPESDSNGSGEFPLERGINAGVQIDFQ